MCIEPGFAHGMVLSIKAKCIVITIKGAVRQHLLKLAMLKTTVIFLCKGSLVCENLCQAISVLTFLVCSIKIKVAFVRCLGLVCQ